MGGAYLEIDPQETYVFTTNVAVNNVAQELYGSTVWFQAWSKEDSANNSPIINLSGNSLNVLITNAVGSSVNSIVNVTLTSALTYGLAQVNVGAWQLTAKTSTGSAYRLDGGRMCVLPNVGASYQ